MTEFKVGLLTLAAIVALIVMSFKITSRQAGFGPYIVYQTIISDAAGIFEKSSIKVAGINAGRIKKIQLYEEKALVTFEILKSVKVTKGSKLELKTVGFFGDKYIDISLNEESTERLPEDSIIPAVQSSGLQNISKNLEEILKETLDVIKNIKASLAPERDGDPFPVQTIVHSLKRYHREFSL